MKKWFLLAVVILAVGLSIVFLRPTPTDNLQTVRIGWQTPLATQGQLIQVLKNTDILEKNGFKAEFVPFSFGSPQVEAAAAGSLDVIFVGDQPALNLVSKGAPWRLTSQLFETRVALLVPPGSKLTLEQMKDKTIASPFGSVAHREAIFFERGAGLDPSTDVKNINVDILEIADLVQSNRWGKIDAVAVWEPSVTRFIERGFAKPIAETKTLGVVAASQAFLGKSDNAERLNKVVADAWKFLLQNPRLANEWYIKDANLDYTQDFLMQALALDRNGKLVAATGSGPRADPGKVNIALTDQDKCTLLRGIRWAKDQGIIQKTPDPASVVYGGSLPSCAD